MADELQRALELKNTVLQADAEYFMRLVDLPPSGVTIPPGLNKYIVEAAVSELIDAGTVAKVELIVNGTTGSSEPLKINSLFSFNLRREETTVHVFDQADIGELLTVDVQLTEPSIAQDQLHLRYVIIVDVVRKQKYIFPCYRWIAEKVTLRVGTATTINRETNPRLQEHRKSELEERRKEFRWGSGDRYHGFPGYAAPDDRNDAPLTVRFADVDRFSFKTASLQAASTFKLHAFTTKNDPLPDFKGFFSLAKGMGTQGDDELVMRHVYDNWTRDEEFGRQFLNGHHPHMLQKFTEIPAKFPVQDELAEMGVTVSDGNLYVADYEALHELLPQEEQSKTAFFCAPICLFRLLHDGNLVPIAIQLFQNPGPESPIWTPRDGFGWLLAKMYVRNADSQIHQAVSHLLKTHLVLEAVTTAMWRQLPSAHPVFKLLLPHTRTTIAINTAARQSLINDGGILDVTLSSGVKGAFAAVRRAFDSLKLADLSFPEAIAARGLDDSRLRFFFRDDGLKLWALIKQYVTEIIGIYYRSDDDVTHDTELQAWAIEMYKFGFPAASNGEHHGFKESIRSIQELTELLTICLFQASAGHASINFSQMAYYGFVPNAPLMMRAPPPTSKSGVTLNTVLKSLGTASDAANQLSIMYTLSRYSPAEILLGVFPEIHFSEAEPNAAAKRFKDGLEILSATIAARNCVLGSHSYPYMSPLMVPNSVAK